MFRRFSAKRINRLQVISVERPTTLLTRQTENREVGAVSFPSLYVFFHFLTSCSFYRFLLSVCLAAAGTTLKYGILSYKNDSFSHRICKYRVK